MELKPEWVNHYLNADQRKTMRDLANESFSKEALRKLRQQEFTQETHQQYDYFRTKLKRLVKAHADPSGSEAQSLAKYLTELNQRRSQGDSEILNGMKKTWENFNALPEDKKPSIYVLTTEEREFIKEACTIFHQQGYNDESRSRQS